MLNCLAKVARTGEEPPDILHGVVSVKTLTTPSEDDTVS